MGAPCAAVPIAVRDPRTCAGWSGAVHAANGVHNAAVSKKDRIASAFNDVFPLRSDSAPGSISAHPDLHASCH